eukprot:XP_011421746.1 PREDICTED: metalloproteinase inhibitor 3 [Crassostrea gigas]
MTKSVILCVVLTIIFVCTYSEACTCNPEPTHPQAYFCGSGQGFVIKAKILKREGDNRNSMDIAYTVRIIQDYTRPGGQYYRRPSVQRIYTASDSAACGAYFRIGEEYIITGDIRNQYWSTNLCSWNFQSSQLTPYQKDALEMGYYKQTCGCVVRPCFNGQCYPPSYQNSCVLGPNDDVSCFFQHNSCRRQGNDCAWHTAACQRY